jgi:acetyltransferase-like isoleucine patch superfamily enzyme
MIYCHSPFTIIPEDVSCHIDLEVGAFTSIASGLTIISGQHPPVENPEVVSSFPFKEWGLGDYPACKMGGLVTIRNDVWIGQNVSIMEGVYIGSGSIIGACSVVTRDISHYEIYTGHEKVPRYRFDPPIIKKLLDIAWWDWPIEKVREAIPHMAHINDFLDWCENG